MGWGQGAPQRYNNRVLKFILFNNYYIISNINQMFVYD